MSLDCKKLLVDYATVFEFGIPSGNTFFDTLLRFTIEFRGKGYGVYYRQDCLSKTDLEFCYETMPSNRDDKFYKEFRFDTITDAFSAALKAFKLMLERHSMLSHAHPQAKLLFFQELDKVAEKLSLPTSGVDRDWLIERNRQLLEELSKGDA